MLIKIKILAKRLAIWLLVLNLTTGTIVANAQLGCVKLNSKEKSKNIRNVIFFHPDGYGLSHWNNLRFWLVGPDGRLNWDRLPYMAPYTGFTKDALTATSHGGATIHAYGVKVVRDSFGLDGDKEIIARSGKKMSIMEESIKAGYATALVQSGAIWEPGTAAFVASVPNRGMNEEIALQVIKSGVDVIMSGGEASLLPYGVKGRHGTGIRKDGINLIEQAEKQGYTVVYNRNELFAAVSDINIRKILGIFAAEHTFNDGPEEELRANGLPLYCISAPSIAEMSDAALQILKRNPKAQEKGIFIVIEEEGTDNFGNNSNASGSFEAGKRADAALGVFLKFLEENPNTLILTCADSSAGGKVIVGPDPSGVDRLIEREGKIGINTDPLGKWMEVYLDGVDGANTGPFISVPDKQGNSYPFWIAWVREDVTGAVLVRAAGLNAERITEMSVVDNTDIYRLMYYTLFGVW